MCVCIAAAEASTSLHTHAQSAIREGKLEKGDAPDDAAAATTAAAPAAPPAPPANDNKNKGARALRGKAAAETERREAAKSSIVEQEIEAVPTP